MADTEPQPSGTATDAVFAMDPEPTLRALVGYLIAGQQQMADLSRDAHAMRACSPDGPDAQRLLAARREFERHWVGQTLPWLTAAMKLALEVYATFGGGMTRIADPVEAAIWNNKYFVWERELSAADRDVSD